MPPFALLTFLHIWLVIPLVVVYCLVYAATRHEDAKSIFRHAGSLMGWMFLFLAVVYALLSWLTR